MGGKRNKPRRARVPTGSVDRLACSHACGRVWFVGGMCTASSRLVSPRLASSVAAPARGGVCVGFYLFGGRVFFGGAPNDCVQMYLCKVKYLSEYLRIGIREAEVHGICVVCLCVGGGTERKNEKLKKL